MPMDLFGNDDNGKGLNIDVEKLLAATAGGLAGASSALNPEPATPPIDWTTVLVVGGLGLGFVLLLTSRR